MITKIKDRYQQRFFLSVNISFNYRDRPTKKVKSSKTIQNNPKQSKTFKNCENTTSNDPDRAPAATMGVPSGWASPSAAAAAPRSGRRRRRRSAPREPPPRCRHRWIKRSELHRGHWRHWETWAKKNGTSETNKAKP